MFVSKLVKCTNEQGAIAIGGNINQGLFLTPLHLAIIQKNVQLVGELLLLGADPNIHTIEYDKIDIRIQTPMSTAVDIGSIEIVGKLIDAGANINFCQYGEEFEDPLPLVSAIRNGDNEMFNYLIKRGANINNEILGIDNYPLIEAVRMSNKEYVRILVEAGASISPKRRLCSFVEAVRLDDLNMVELLVKLGGGINRKGDLRRKSALMYAIINKNFDMINFLLQNGADPNEYKGKKYNILYYAIKSQLLGIIDRLLVEGLDINKHTRNINSLETSLKHGTYEITKRLLDNNAVIDDMENIKLPDIYTHFERQYILLFLDYPCDINVKNTEDQTLFDLVKANNDTELLEIIEQLQNP